MYQQLSSTCKIVSQEQQQQQQQQQQGPRSCREKEEAPLRRWKYCFIIGILCHPVCRTPYQQVQVSFLRTVGVQQGPRSSRGGEEGASVEVKWGGNSQLLEKQLALTPPLRRVHRQIRKRRSIRWRPTTPRPLIWTVPERSWFRFFELKWISV